MDDGFRSSTMCMPFAYTQYDASGVDASTLTAPPALESLPSSDQKRLDTYSTYANGSCFLFDCFYGIRNVVFLQFLATDECFFFNLCNLCSKCCFLK